MPLHSLEDYYLPSVHGSKKVSETRWSSERWLSRNSNYPTLARASPRANSSRGMSRLAIQSRKIKSSQVETDKALVDVPSPYNGTVKELLAEEGEMVPVGDVIITFEVEGDGPKATEAALQYRLHVRTALRTQSQLLTFHAKRRSQNQHHARPGARPAVCAASRPRTGRRYFQRLRTRLRDVYGAGCPRVRESGILDSGAFKPTDHCCRATNTAGSPAQSVSPAQTREVETGDDGGRPENETVERGRIDPSTVPTDEQEDGEPLVTLEAVQEYAEAQQQAQQTDRDAVVERAAADEPARPESRKPYKGIRQTLERRYSVR